MKNIYFDNIREDVIKLIPPRSYHKIIEIGGGGFSTLEKIASKYQSEAWGVDIYDFNNKSIKFVKGSIEENSIIEKIPNDYFDLFMANDVIEHLVDTEKFIMTAYDKLKKDGIFIISVPNIRQLRAAYLIFIKGNFERKSAGLFDKTHLRWFCKKDVEIIANGHFELLDAKGVGRFVPEIISRTMLSEFLSLQNIFIFRKRD
jgi:2-polyprenyl-3-methyl-5-hydroxy-6-metoxy-1,4-benzoquinol methylase